MANWGKIYCSSYWGDESNKNSIPTSQFEQCGAPPEGYTPPTNLTINEFLYRQFRLNWTNTAFTGTIETIRIYIQLVGASSQTIINEAFDPTKPNTKDFNMSVAGNYTVRLQYSDPTNGLSGFSNTVPFTVT